jgi:ABC-type uncharacterized transport system auxiliary subunit
MRSLVLLVLVSGCAFMKSNHAPPIHYYTPETVEAASDPPSPLHSTLALRLARVDAAAYIQDRIAFRDDSAEVGYYGNLRWSEPPEAYLRRAMARTLFQRHGMREIVSGAGPALEVDLEAFEELRAPRHVARVVVTWRLRDDRTVLVERTLTVERPIRGDERDRVANADAVAHAIAGALDGVVDELAGEVVDALAPGQNTSAAGVACGG